MRKSFIKNPSYISGIIALLFIITISLFIVIILIKEYDFYTNLFFLLVLLIVYLPSILTLIFLFGYKINFNDEGIYTTLFNKNKKLISNYNEIKKVEIYTLRGLRIELTLNSNETIELEYRKEIVFLFIDNCNEKVKEYLVKYLEKK